MKSPTTHFRRCPECGADYPSSATRCWLCRRELNETDDVHLLETEAAARRRHDTVENLLTILVVGTGVLTLLVLVGAVLRNAAGLALLLALCAAPVVLAVGIVKLMHSADSKKSDWRGPVAVALGTVGTLLLGFVAGVVIVVLMIASAITAFFTACSEMLGGVR